MRLGCKSLLCVSDGGGAVLDGDNYSSSSSRGIRLIWVPTTVLAQNDSSVGVKNGINTFGKKNFGDICAAYAVLNDVDFPGYHGVATGEALPGG